MPDVLGIDERIAQELELEQIRLELAVRACRHVGLERAVVPHAFPAGHLERLRAAKVELTVDQGLFSQRRRVKSELELAGIRRAQRAAEAGMRAAAEPLAQAEPRDGCEVLTDFPYALDGAVA